MSFTYYCGNEASLVNRDKESVPASEPDVS